MIINTSSVGMKAEGPMLIDQDRLASQMAIAEIIMTPELTPLLLAAQKRGCKTSLGKHMLEGTGAASQRVLRALTR